MPRYKVVAACCFLTGLNIMLEHGDITPEELHENDAKSLVAQGFLEEADEWDVPAQATPSGEAKEEVKEKVTTGRNKR